MILEIEVLNVSPVQEAPNGRGGKFKSVEIAFKEVATGKVSGKKIVDFANPDFFAKISAAKIGEKLAIQLEKKDKYWNWVGFADGAVSDASTAAQTNSSAPAGRAASTKVVGSNYETPEERKARQRYIVRQSSITAALTYSELHKAKPNVEDVIGIAKQFEAYVFDDNKGVQAILDMEDDIPQ